MTLIVFFSSRISPRTSTVIFLERSPSATAVVTSAMLRTWPVRLAASSFTLLVRSFQVPPTPSTLAWPPSLPSEPTSRATRLTSEAKELSWSTMVLMVFLSSRISPFTSTVIFLERSPEATAVVTSAMLRTWPVRLPAMAFTLSVRSAQVPATPSTCAWPPSLPSEPTSRATRVTSEAKAVELVDHDVDRVLQLEDLALHVDGDLLRKVAAGHGGGHLGDVADLAGQVGGHQVHVVGEIGPGAGDSGHLRLAAELAFGADLAGHAGHLGGEAVELVDHGVDRVLELEDLALHVDRDLLGKIARGHGGGHLGDVADLAGEVVGHQVHVVGQILPGAADARHLRLAAELAFGADLPRHAGHLGGEGVELVDHDVDRVLELEDLALHVDGDLLGQVARGHGGGHLGDVADLAGQVLGHQVHVVGQVLPGAGDAFHPRLAAELAFGADLAGDAGHLRGEAS